ncbi:desmoplakin-B [Gadus morhua]|uniref:desmoplakin-B n=1 Tax=Gadus morhua TaxID=8049 RepID=UPI0011B47463|nr:plectin-like [Gadus morhua]
MRLEEEVRKREKAMKREEEKRRMAETQRLEEEVRLREEKRKIEEAKRKVELQKVEVKKDHAIKKEAVRTIKAESVKRKTSSSAFSSTSSSSSSFHGSSSHSLMELRTLRTRMESAEGSLNQHIHISLGDDKVRECGLRITELETVQRDIDDIQGDILRIKDMILMEVEGMADADKAQFLRSDIGGITQRLGVLDSSLSAYLQRLRALRNLLESVSHGEDIVKVHEARLTEKDTTSLSPGEVEDYIMYLKNMKVELDQKRDVFDSMEAEMEKANNWNSQVGDSSLRCDMTLATYSELVGQLTNRWRRIHTQIDCRMKDLEFYVPQLQQYKKDSTSLDEWIDSTQKRQKALQSTKIEDLETVVLHISQQKALNSEIKEKRRTLDSVLTESGDCVSSIKDYESDLAAYGSGLETLLNIPIKRTILTSPSTELNQEAVEMQTRYMELFTLSGDYYTYLGAMQKNMEELKIRNTRIDLLEEELRLLKGSIESNTTKNRQLQDALARYQLELSNSKEQLLSVENGNEDESRKRRLAEDRYNKQKEEYEILLRRAEKNMTDKEREAEQLRQRLADESARVRELQLETSKTTEDLERIKLSLESECHIKQRLQEENDRLKNEFRFLKDKYDSQESKTRQHDSDKDRFEQEINDLKGEIQRLRKDSEVIISRKTMATDLKAVREPPNLIFDGVRKTVTAKQLHDCGVLDELTFNKLLEGKKRVPAVSVDKKVILKGTGPIAGVVIASQKGTFSLSGPLSKMSLTEAKKGNLIPLDCADLLLDAQAATGHMIDPRLNQKLTVEEACDQGLVDENDRQRLLAAEAAAVGYHDPGTGQPLSAFQAMKKGLIDKSTALRLLQAQECTGGILDPTLSVFLPKDIAIERDLINEDIYRALNQRPELYMDPETELGASYISLKRRCQKEPNTGLLLLPVSKKLDPSKLVFDGVRKPVTAKQLNDCGVLDKPMLDQLLKGEISVQDVSVDKKIILKGTGPIAGVIIASAKGTVSLSGPLSKMSLSEAKEKDLLPLDCADLLLDAQAATGHMIDPITNQKLTVEEACDQGLVAENDRQRLLAAEAAAVGYHDRGTGKPLSAFQAMKKGLIDNNTALRLIQAQESTGGFLDPILSVFVPKDIAYERDLINEQMDKALNQRPALYLDPTTEQGASYGSLKRRCKTEPNTGLLLLPVPQRLDPSNLVFDGVRKPVTAKQLLDCGVIDKPTFKELCTGEKTVSEVSTDKIVSLKGNGPIAAVIVGNQVKMSFAEAKKQGLVPPESANMLLEAQAATGHIIDSRTNQNLTVEEACDKGVVAREDRDRLLAAEAAAIGYYDRRTAKHLSVFEAMKKGIVDKKTALTLLQAQESAGGILDPVKSVFLPKDTAIKHKLLDEELKHALNQQPEYYIDPETEMGVPYEVLRKRCKTESHTGLILLPISEKQDPSLIIFDGVRKPVNAQQLLDCGVLDKPTFKELVKGDKTVPQVSLIKRDSLKGTGCISGVIAGKVGKMSFDDAKKQGLLSKESADLLLEAQAATGHIIDPRSNHSLTVEEACDKGVVAKEDRERLLAAEAAAIGYNDRSTSRPLSVFDAIKKGLVDMKTALTLLQAQESAGGILDPVKSVFLPKDTAIKHNLLDEELKHALNQQPEYYIDPETEKGVTYESLKRRCKTESHTGLILLPISGRQDPNKLIFDGVRKPVTAQQLLDCGVLDKPTFNQLLTKEKTIPDVSKDKKTSLKGTGAIAAVIAGDHGKISFAEAKKQGLIPTDSANKLLEAQAATGHIIDPETNTKLTVEEACVKGVVAKEDRERLLAAESAAIGYNDRTTAKPLSVFEALNKGIVDKKTALTLLQAQESAGGILDPVNSVFLPRDNAIKGKLIDEELKRSLNQQPECYIDPDTEKDVTYESLKRRCKTEYDTGLLLLPISGKQDPNKLIFDGVRKPVTAQQLLDCGVLDKPTFNQLLKKEKTIPDVSKDKKISLKGTGAIAAVIAGDYGKMSFAEAKKQGLIPTDSANKLLEAQAATGHIIDPETNKKLTVEEACVKGVVAKEDRERLLAAESAAIGYTDRTTAKCLSVFEALKKGIVDKKNALTLLQAQESAGGILDPVNSVFLPRDTAIKGKLIDEELKRSLNQQPECYIDPDTEKDVTYESLKRRCKTEYDTGLLLLPISGKQDPNKLIFDGVRKPVTAQQLLDCGVLDKPTFNQLLKKEKTIPDVSKDKKISLKGTGAIAAVIAGDYGKMSFAEAKKQGLIPTDSANKLMEAQAATGHIIDPETNAKLTVEEACVKGVVAKEDRERLLAAESAAIGYTDRTTAKCLSVFEALKKGIVDKKNRSYSASGSRICRRHSRPGEQCFPTQRYRNKRQTYR